MDEVHKLKGGVTANGYTLAALLAGAKRALIMTGTLFGGKATDIFFLLYRAGLLGIRDVYSHTDSDGFARQYGMWKRTFKGNVTAEQAVSYAYNKARLADASQERAIEIPGINPALVSLLLPVTAFMSIEDLGIQLPPFAEEVRRIQPDPEMRDGIKAISNALEFARSNQFTLGLSAWSKASAVALGWPNTPTRNEKIVFESNDLSKPPETVLIPGALARPDFGFNRDVAVIKAITDELAQGRRCIVACSQTQARDPRPRLMNWLEALRIPAASLDSTTVDSMERQAWFARQVEEGVVVTLLNPALIAEGVNLLDWPTIINYGLPTYSLLTMSQFTKRHHRTGQDKPCKVLHYVYAGMLESTGLNIVGEKQNAASVINGDLDSGLASLGRSSGDDLITALKKASIETDNPELSDDYIAHSQVEAWREELRQGIPATHAGIAELLKSDKARIAAKKAERRRIAAAAKAPVTRRHKPAPRTAPKPQPAPAPVAPAAAPVPKLPSLKKLKKRGKLIAFSGKIRMYEYKGNDYIVRGKEVKRAS